MDIVGVDGEKMDFLPHIFLYLRKALVKSEARDPTMKPCLLSLLRVFTECSSKCQGKYMCKRLSVDSGVHPWQEFGFKGGRTVFWP